jgi:DNA end-binding protein Ku
VSRKVDAPQWTGTIVSGMLRVPVRLWRAQPTDRPAVPLTTLHRECMAPIKRAERCSECAQELRPEDKITAYELGRGEYVPVDRADLPRPEAEEKHTVEVEDWIPLAQLDPIQLASTYYLAPAEGTERAYALLHRAMLQTGAAVVARVALKTRESLCAVYPRGAHLVLSTLHIASEMPEVAAPGADGVPVSERDFDELVSTIARRMVPMNPYRYTDRQTDAAMAEIRRKVEEHAGITRLPVRRAAGKVA